MLKYLHDENDIKIYVPGSLNSASADRDDSGSDAQILLWEPGSTVKQSDPQQPRP